MSGGNIEVPATDAEREQLIVRSLPMVRIIARQIMAKMPRHHAECSDLVSAGVIGLIDAADKFDPALRVNFTTYAQVRVRGAILDHLRELASTSVSWRRKKKKLAAARSALNAQLKRDATDCEVAAAMGVRVEDFPALVDGLREPTTSSIDSREVDIIDSEADPAVAFAKLELREIFLGAINSLPATERIVVMLYYYEDFNQREIAEKLGVHATRVSQLRSSATARLQRKLSAAIERWKHGA